MKTLIIIPAYDEEKSIAAVIFDLESHGYKNILVVDDGSSDKTAARATGAVTVRHVINRGLGAALGTGFEYARKNNFDIAVTFDADGQHKAKDIKRILAPLSSGRADVVVGSRLVGNKKNIPLDRLILNYLSNLATLFLYRVWATDTLSGLRAFDKKAINCIKIKTQRMEVSNEFFREIKRNQLRFCEVPVRPVYTEYSLKGSHQGRFPVIRLAVAMILRLFR